MDRRLWQGDDYSSALRLQDPGGSVAPPVTVAGAVFKVRQAAAHIYLRTVRRALVPGASAVRMSRCASFSKWIALLWIQCALGGWTKRLL